MAIVSKPEKSGFVVRCDKCGKESNRASNDLGDAAVYARNEGFKPVFASREDPAIWVCPNCQKGD